MLQAGVTEVVITPPIGVELSGYGPDLERYSTDLHDPLLAQVLVLDDGQTRAALIALDLIGASAPFVRDVRQAIEARTGIPAAQVMVAAAHIHTAPTTAPSRAWGNPDPGYIPSVVRHLAGAAAASQRKLAPVRLSVGRTEYADLAWNRIGKPEVDPTVEVIRLDDAASGDPLVILVHYACHPVILGPKPIISADYVGSLRRHLRQRYPGSTVLFLNGTCGDIDPVTNRAVWGQGTFDDVDRAGAGLAEAAWQAVQSAQHCAHQGLRVTSRRVLLEYDTPDLSTVREKIEQYERQSRAAGGAKPTFRAVTDSVEMPDFWLDFYRSLDRRISGGTMPRGEEVELQAIALADDLLLLGIPAEVYTRTGMRIRQQSRHAHTWTVCYANGIVGYIPPAEEYEKGSYAALLGAAISDHPPFTADVSGRVINAALELCTE